MKTTSWEQMKTMIGGMGRALRRNIADALALAKEAKTTATEAKAKADRAQKQFSLVLGDDSSITAKKFNEMWDMTEAELQGAITVTVDSNSHAVTGLYKLEYGEGIEGKPLSRHIEMMVRDSFNSEVHGYGEKICGLYYSKGIYNGIKFEMAGWNTSGQSFRVDFDTDGNIIPAMATEEAIRDRTGAAWSSGAEMYAITPKNLDTAIKYGLIDNRLTLTEAEQQAAKDWLNIRGITEDEIENLKPEVGVDYWTEDDKQYILSDTQAFIIEELALRGQLKPEFAQSVEQCTDETKLYVLPDGYIYAYMLAPGAGLYVNHLPIAKDTDGSVYNSIGYKPNTRLSISSGVFDERTETGWCASGLIKATYGDVVRLENCVCTKSNPAGDSHRGGVFGADENGAFVAGNTSTISDITSNTSNPWQIVYDEDGDNIIQFTIPSHLKNSTYIRIVVQEFNANSIITVNEEIVDAEPVKAWVNTGRAFVPADYEGRIADVEDRAENNTKSVNSLVKRVGALEGEEYEAVKVPDYWKEHLDSRVADIRSALVAAGRNKSAFLWWHDAHWTYNFKQSPALLKYLHDNTVINKTFYGGDVLDAEEGLDLDVLAYAYDWRKAIRDLPNHYSVIGNHDDGNHTETDGNIPDGFIYSFLMAAEEKPHVVYGDGYYYYFDEPAEKTRYIFCDTATRDGNIGNEDTNGPQTQFVKSALLTTPEGWHIVCIAHIWCDVDYTVNPPVATGFSSGGQKLLNMFDDYNARSGDYTNAVGKVEFCIGAHTHRDEQYTSTGGICVILTETDSRHVRSAYSATGGTTDENSVNAIIADYTAKEVHVIRVGRGESRHIVL